MHLRWGSFGFYCSISSQNTEYTCISCFQGHREWINEVNLLGVIKHPNLVKLVGYCAEDDERGIQRLLVYELMRNKSLEDHLLGRVPSTLTWISRLKIAQDAARGLGYLHEEMDFQVNYVFPSFEEYSYCVRFLLTAFLNLMFGSHLMYCRKTHDLYTCLPLTKPSKLCTRLLNYAT